MKRLISAALAGAMAVTTVSVPAFAQGPSAMPTIWSASQAQEGVQEARWHRHRRHYRGGYYPRYRYHRHRDNNYGAAAAAGIIGLAAGAALAAGANNGYRSSDRDAYCYSKYKSYDARTGTYLGYDGHRHPCR